PKNFRHGYDVEINEGQICKEAHLAVNAYYLAAVGTANKIAALLSLPQYREETPLLSAFYATFYDEQKHLFKDGENTEHISLVGNSFVYGFGLCADPAFQRNFLEMLKENGISSLSLFCTFPVLMGLVQNDRYDLVKQCLLEDGAWRRILKEGGTTTFEGWGKDTKWNTSLFHLTLSYAATFMAEIDLERLFKSPSPSLRRVIDFSEKDHNSIKNTGW
ncbi:MAG: hypothetical protein IJN42_01000, partial [Clostridia bacterium]|nr:hypothetical protein [Clostridia bacterium]